MYTYPVCISVFALHNRRQFEVTWYVTSIPPPPSTTPTDAAAAASASTKGTGFESVAGIHTSPSPTTYTVLRHLL